MHMLRKALTALLFAPALSVFAQKHVVDKIVIKGAAPYTDDEVLSAAALKPGDVLTKDTISGPAQHLLDTGLFDVAEMELSGPGNHTAVISLKPYPNDKLLPASFENYVWWTPEELAKALHEKVPLFHGYCADAGNLPDLVQAALDDLLLTKGVTATSEHSIVEPTTEHPQRIIDFRIDQPGVRIATLNLTVDSPTPVDDASIKAFTQRLIGTFYNEGLAGTNLEDRLLQPWREQAYYMASVSSLQRQPAAIAKGLGVAVQATVHLGSKYKFTSVTWQPTPVFSAADFQKIARIRPGDAYSVKTLSAEEAAVLNAYGMQGYLYAYLLDNPTVNDTLHAVGFSLQVVPGDQYRLKSITVNGLSPQAKAVFDTEWKLRPGDLYDSNYFNKFILSHVAMPGPLKGYGAGTDLLPDAQAHTVDLTITYQPRVNAQ